MLEFWIKQIITVIVYIGTLMFSILNFSTETSRVLAPILTTVFVWVMNNTFSKDYQEKIDKKIETYKNELDKKLETHKAKLSGYTLVTKLQYDLEFEIYTNLFGSLTEVLLSTRGMINFRKRNDKFYFDKYINDSNKFSDTFQKYYPFYSKKIHSICREIFLEGQEIKDEYEEYKKTGNFNEEKCNQKISRMTDLKEEVSELIKKRIENMKIVE